MSQCGLKEIKFGVDQEIHMYGIFELGSQDPDNSILEYESKRILKIIQRAQLKEDVGRILDKIGAKEFTKSLLKKFSPKKIN